LDLLRDSIAFLSPPKPHLLAQLSMYYSHSEIGYGKIWKFLFLGHFVTLLISTLSQLQQNGFIFSTVIPSLCVVSIVVLNALFLDPAKKTLTEAKNEDAVASAGKKVFITHSVMGVICLVHAFTTHI